MKELELLTLDGLKSIFKRGDHPFVIEPGTKCANCGTELMGVYCYTCGQTADDHHRSFFHLVWEAIEGLFHLDGRLWRTLPPLLFRPGLLNRDLLERRIQRHVPPLRLFFVALLLFMFAAEHRLDVLREEGAQRTREAEATARDPVKLQAALNAVQAEANKDYADDLGDARSDHDEAVKDATNDAERAKAEADYQADLATAAKSRDREVMAGQARVRKGEADNFDMFTMTPDQARTYAGGKTFAPEAAPEIKTGKPSADFKSRFKNAVHRVMSNLDLFYVTLFTWAHRLAILLWPIMGFSLGLLYVHKRQYFIYDHMLVAANMLSFFFLTNAVALTLPDGWSGWFCLLLMVWTPVNIFMTLRGAYGSSILGAVLKTLILWTLATVSFVCVLLGVVYVAMMSV